MPEGTYVGDSIGKWEMVEWESGFAWVCPKIVSEVKGLASIGDGARGLKRRIGFEYDESASVGFDSVWCHAARARSYGSIETCKIYIRRNIRKF